MSVPGDDRFREGVCKIIIRNDLYAGSELSKAASAIGTRLEAPYRRSNLLNVTNGQSASNLMIWGHVYAVGT